MSRRRLALLTSGVSGLVATLSLPVAAFIAAMLLPPIPGVQLRSFDGLELRFNCNPYTDGKTLYCGFIVHGTSHFQIPADNLVAQAWCNARAADTYGNLTPRRAERHWSVGLLPRVKPGWQHCQDLLELHTGFLGGIYLTLP